jgi:hypothetical protein
MNTEFKSFAAMLTALPTDAACREYLEMKRWNGTPVCPHCGVVDANHYKLNVKGEFKGMYKCRSCKERFTVTLGTMFEGSPIPLRKWFIAAYIFSAHKKGVSSHQLARDLDVTQKTAWFMLHRLRMAFTDTNDSPLGGEGVIVETDATIVGGKTKTMSNKKRKSMKGDRNTAMANKTIVTAYVERGGSIRFDVKDNGENEPDMVRKHVDAGSVLMTDTANAYLVVGKEYADHQSVDHSKDEYVRDGYIHTNTIEGAFSHFDRMVFGTYHHISRKHMQAYCNESGFRYNSRKVTDKARFDMALIKTAGVKLNYSILIAK